MPADPPPEVQITVTVVPHDRWRSVRRLGGAALGLVLIAGIALFVLTDSRPATKAATSVTAKERAAVAAAFGYPYPLRCLNIAIYGAFARAHVDRTGTCAQYRGYLNATFHLIDGRWRLVLDEGQLFVPNAQLVGSR